MIVHVYKNGMKYLSFYRAIAVEEDVFNLIVKEPLSTTSIPIPVTAEDRMKNKIEVTIHP